MNELVAAGAPWPGAVAVSGGGDSVALMHLLTAWAKKSRVSPPHVVTVDHGLRKDSAADARRVVRWAKSAGLKPKALRWTGPKPKSDVEAAAREARYRLIGDWARKNKIAALYVAHTRDDQAETFLLRLMRGSRPIQTWFPYGSGPEGLNLTPQTVTRRIIMQKARRHTSQTSLL